MAKYVLLLRHAHYKMMSGELSEKGKSETQEMSEIIDIILDQCVSDCTIQSKKATLVHSPVERATETTEILSSCLESVHDIVEAPEVKIKLGREEQVKAREELVARLNKTPDDIDVVIVVTHEQVLRGISKALRLTEKIPVVEFRFSEGVALRFDVDSWPDISVEKATNPNVAYKLGIAS